MPNYSTRMRRATGAAVVTLIIAVPLNGCGGSIGIGSTANTSTPTTADPQPSPSTSSESPPSAAITPDTQSPSSTETTEAPPPDEPVPDSGDTTPTRAILNPESAGKVLTLADFFQPDSIWSENRSDVADLRQVQGIGTEIGHCDRVNAQMLELRLANNFKTLRINVGQANNSVKSDQKLIVAIVGNNSQIDIQKIPFNVIQKMTIPVADINALQILFYLDGQIPTCGSGTVSAVLFKAILG